MANPKGAPPPLGIIGVDTGGTFTDFIARWLTPGSSRPIRTIAHKVLSTPDNPGDAVVRGLEQLLTRSGIRQDQTHLTVVHGSTVATNALLERKGVKTAFITTAGFEDLLHIGRQARRYLYDLRPQPTRPLIAEGGCFGADERLDPEGHVLRSLSSQEVDRLVALVKRFGAQSVALCLLFSFVEPRHEKMLAQALRDAGLFVSASHAILPEYREYERATTTVINAYVSPIMQRYLHDLENALLKSGIKRMHVMQSNGGSISPRHAGEHGVHTVLSGPAGGVVGAFSAAQSTGTSQIITFDMGGTSTDVALLPGRLETTTESEIDGMPIKVPSMAIHTVGAGGGSIAFLDSGGALRVGPRSAGASPGPACYGRGGVAPTVTDAHVVLGRLPADAFLGGGMPLLAKAAHAAIQSLGKTLDAPVDHTAWAILQVANIQMERALRLISIERGYDPGEFTLVSFGGAGGLHAVDLARNLGIPKVFIPTFPGVLSAWGMAVADVVKTTSQGVIGPLNDTLDGALNALHQLIDQAVRDIREEARHDGTIHLEPSLDLRYQGQSFELTIDLAPTTWQTESGEASLPRLQADPNALTKQFHAAHLKRYAHRSDDPIELVAVRLRAWCRGPLPESTPNINRPLTERARLTPAHTTVRAFIDGDWQQTAVYPRERLVPNMTLSGPAIITEEHATTLIGCDDKLDVDTEGNLSIRIG